GLPPILLHRLVLSKTCPISDSRILPGRHRRLALKAERSLSARNSTSINGYLPTERSGAAPCGARAPAPPRQQHGLRRHRAEERRPQRADDSQFDVQRTKRI